jgi:sugar phosphate permease
MEFSSSMMWTACSVLMAERYASDGKKFAAGITSLSLASTTGTLIAKVAGGALLSQFHWRQVCLLSAVVASLGSGILYFLRDEQVKEVDADAVNGNAGAIELSSGGQSSEKSGPSLGSIGSTVSRVLGNRMFYSIALAHFGAFIVRTSEKVIGAFLADTTELPSK